MTDETTASTNATGEAIRRWYDHDPILVEVLEILRSFQDEVRTQAESFLQKIEEQVGKETLDSFYEKSRPDKFGNRWYDADPVVSKAVELLRVVPPPVQREAAQKFLQALKQQGLSPDILQRAESLVDN